MIYFLENKTIHYLINYKSYDNQYIASVKLHFLLITNKSVCLNSPFYAKSMLVEVKLPS